LSQAFSVLDFYLFSSRRRHTRFSRDWSSDVCSSDLSVVLASETLSSINLTHISAKPCCQISGFSELPLKICFFNSLARKKWRIRSEERRVGKECRSRWSSSR